MRLSPGSLAEHDCTVVLLLSSVNCTAFVGETNSVFDSVTDAVSVLELLGPISVSRGPAQPVSSAIVAQAASKSPALAVVAGACAALACLGLVAAAVVLHRRRTPRRGLMLNAASLNVLSVPGPKKGATFAHAMGGMQTGDASQRCQKSDPPVEQKGHAISGTVAALSSMAPGGSNSKTIAADKRFLFSLEASGPFAVSQYAFVGVPPVQKVPSADGNIHSTLYIARNRREFLPARAPGADLFVPHTPSRVSMRLGGLRTQKRGESRSFLSF
jgi:hypothetical protein